MHLFFRPSGQTFLGSQSGAALIEFALVFPVLMALFLGVQETTRILRANHHMTNYVNAVAYDVAGASTNINQSSLREMIDRAALMVPEIIRDGMSPWSSSPSGYLDVGITMVRMTPRDATCQRGCTYKATVAWSFGNLRRACGELDSASAAAAPTLVSLPAGVFQSGALAVVDINTDYRFLFTSGLVPPKNLRTAGYFPVRNWRQGSVSAVPLLTGSDSTYSANICPL